MVAEVKRRHCLLGWAAAVLGAAALALLSLMSGASAGAQPSAAVRVEVVGDHDGIAAGSTFDVNIVVEVAEKPGLEGVAFDLMYDPRVLKAELIERGEPTREMQCFMNDVKDVNPASPTDAASVPPDRPALTGRARLGCVYLPLRDSGPGGKVVAAVVRFKALKAGESDLVLRGVQIAEAGREKELVFNSSREDKPTDGHVAVVAGPSSIEWGVIAPSVVVGLIVVGLLAYGGLRLRGAKRSGGR